jgi:hypothetical protein
VHIAYKQHNTMNDVMVDNFDELSFWFLYHYILLMTKELLFSREEPVACYDSILTDGDLYCQELMNMENESYFHSAV